MLLGRQQWVLKTGAGVAVILAKVTAAVSYPQQPLATHLKVLMNSIHSPPMQSSVCRKLHRLEDDQEPSEPTPYIPRDSCCSCLAVFLLTLCLVLELQHYKHHITRKVRLMAHSYVRKRLKGKLYSSLKTFRAEFCEELLRTVGFGLGKIATAEVSNIIINELCL